MGKHRRSAGNRKDPRKNESGGSAAAKCAPEKVCQTDGSCRRNIGNIDIFAGDCGGGRALRKRYFHFGSGEFCNDCGDRHTKPSRDASDNRPSDCESIGTSTRDDDTG